MTHDPSNTITEDIGDSFTHLLQPLEDKAQSACHSISKEASEIISRTNEKIRKNPLPTMAGLFAFGLALGYLIKSSRHCPSRSSYTLRDPLNDVGEAVSKSLGTVYKNAKFW